MNSAEEKINVMQAYVDGKEIEVMFERGQTWMTMDHEPLWDWSHCNYRVKPEPIVRWANVRSDGNIDTLYGSRETADAYGNGRTRCVKLIEVLDE